jgi:hypothetical protein
LQQQQATVKTHNKTILKINKMKERKKRKIKEKRERKNKCKGLIFSKSN